MNTKCWSPSKGSETVVLSMLLFGSAWLLPIGNACADPPPSGAATILRTVDGSGLVGHNNSIVLNRFGNPVISYRSLTDDSLELAVCEDPSCISAQVTTVDPNFTVGRDTSLELSSSGFPVIAYMAFGEGLRVAICDNDNCTDPTIKTIDNPASNGVSEFASLALTSNDIPVISYFDCCPTSRLRLAICSDATCTGVSLTTLDAGTQSGEDNSLVLNSIDAPVVSYSGNSGDEVKIAICSDADCSSASIATLDGNILAGTSVAIGPLGRTFVAYRSLLHTLKMVVCNNALCTNLSFTTVDDTTDVQGLPSLVLNRNGVPVISYWDSSSEELRVAACNDVGCFDPTVSILDNQVGQGHNSLALDSGGNPVISYLGAGDLNLAICNNCFVPSRNTLDSPGNVGQYSSIALNSRGFPVVSYYDADNSDLKLAVCDDVACTDPFVTTVDGGPTTIGFYTSLALKGNDSPVISYWDVSNFALKLAVCNDAICSSPSFETVDDTSASIGTYSSVVLNGSGFPVISYYDESNKALRVAVCNDATCSNPTRKTLDGSVDMVGRHTSLVLNSNGFPVISYYDQTNTSLKLVTCDDALCNSSTPRFVDNDVGFDGVMGTSVALNSQGFPVIGYYDATNGHLRLAVCNDATCTVPDLTTVDATGDVGRYADLGLTLDDFPVISYFDDTDNDLKVAVCNDTHCTNPTLTTVSGLGNVGEHSSMQLDRLGYPVISYFDGTPNADLKVAVLGSPLVFRDGFESGTLLTWSTAFPPP